ncbi:MAG: Tetratricopeptide 1 repeat-containing protein, partial [Bacteroidetes bacterium]|nr:Tetratricopeptide 1 repeat-containing protein [Bacteroidota bacterium]
ALSKIYPEREAVYNMLSSLYKQTGEYDKAIRALDKLESYVGINEYLSFEKFQLYAALNKAKKATAEIDKLVAKYPSETRYQVLRGDIFMDQKQPEKAFEIYQRVLADDPANPFVYISLANYYKEKKQPDKALESIVSALKNPALPSDTKMDILGQYVDKLLSDDQKIGETEELFRLLVEMYPLEEKPHAYYAHFLQNQKRFPEALSELQSVIDINPKNEIAWLTSLQILSEKEDTLAILDLTKRGIKELPKIPQFYFYKSMAEYQLGEYDASLKTNEEALLNVESASSAVISSFYGQIGDIYYKLNNKGKAFLNYEKALEQNPANVYVMNNYAYYLSEEKLDLRKAERMSAKTVELEPKNSTYLDTYAWILYQQGNFSLAKFYIERAVDNLEKEHDPGVILEHYGDILLALKNENKALEMWQKAWDSGKTDEALKIKIEKANLNIENVK